MAHDYSKSVRFPDDFGDVKFSTSIAVRPIKHTYNHDRTKISGSSYKFSPENVPRSLKARVLSRVFSEDYERVKKRILDPQGPIVHRWNKIFLVACLVSLSVDPLFFYLPEIKDTECIDIKVPLEVVLTIVRSLADMFYWFKIFVQFRIAFIAPSSRVFGRGELVIDPSKISARYFSKDFWIDLIAALPLPQVLISFVIPYLKGSMMTNTKNLLWFFIISQYIARLFLIFPLTTQIVNATGVMTETAWAGAAYNLLLFMLASHVLGSCWYLLSIKRLESCWRRICNLENPTCQLEFFYCKSNSLSRDLWFQSSNITDLCNPSNSFFDFGIYGEAVDTGLQSAPFPQKTVYCLWWGLRNLSSLGQNLSTSTALGEMCFAVLICVLGLVLFALLIGNMQSFLQSTTTRLEGWRIKITDTEQWMHHRQLPPELRQLVRRHNQHKWIATQGVNEEVLMRGLPMDIRRDIKRHLCLDLVRRVPLLNETDEMLLDAICERLKPTLYTNGTYLVREFDPVNEMLFIIRGHLDSYTTNGGRSEFLNSCRIGPGDFCGEELLMWAIYHRPAINLPSSTRTVKAITEVEAFAIVAGDLSFVASQFRRLLNKQLRHRFRFQSPLWRTWAAGLIQAAWHRHKRRRASVELKLVEEEEEEEDAAIAVEKGVPTASESGGTTGGFTQRMVLVSTRRDQDDETSVRDSSVVSRALQKPTEPDFSMEEER